MFIIRADGNSAIGMGHVMRCLSIADAMKSKGISPLFITACVECVPLITQRGFNSWLLNTDYRYMESEIDLIREYIQEHGDMKAENNVILVDSYQVTDNYYLGLRQFAKVACLEDMGQGHHVDVLINYNIYGQKLKSEYERYYKQCNNKITGDKITTELLLGTAYLPLRNEFLTDTDYSLREKVTDVMITTGGGDPCFATKEITDVLLRNRKFMQSGLRYHIVSGPFNKFKDELHRLYDKEASVVIHENMVCLKELMRECDVVISATGSTIYEVSALGVPLIAFYFVENQRQGAEELSRITHIVNCGNFSESPAQTTAMIEQTLLRCLEHDFEYEHDSKYEYDFEYNNDSEYVNDFEYNFEYRRILYREEKQLVDGQGASRIAEALCGLGSKLY